MRMFIRLCIRVLTKMPKCHALCMRFVDALIKKNASNIQDVVHMDVCLNFSKITRFYSKYIHLIVLYCITVYDKNKIW